MYAAHFGLREPPFNNTPDPRYFYATPDHEEALASLVYAVSELKGYVLLTGEVGTGKTLVSRMMLRHFGNRVSSAVVNNTSLGADDLLAAVCAEFDLAPSASATRFELFRALQNHLLAEFAANRPVVLVLDEGQNLPDQAFEQLRMIGNLEADDAKLLQMVIVGQVELRDRFAAPAMRQLRQRIFRSFHLTALSPELCAGYIRHRLSVARLGTSIKPQQHGTADVPLVFDQDAIELIYQYSQGLPRLINTLCDNAMLTAYAADRHHVDGDMARTVAAQTLGDDSIPAGTTRAASHRLSNPPGPEPQRSHPDPEPVRQAILAGLEPRLAQLEARTAELSHRVRHLGQAAAAPRPTPNPGDSDLNNVETRLGGLIDRASTVLAGEQTVPGPPAPESRRNRPARTGTDNAPPGDRSPHRLQDLAVRGRSSLDALRSLCRRADLSRTVDSTLDGGTCTATRHPHPPPSSGAPTPATGSTSQHPLSPTAELARDMDRLADVAAESIHAR
ncbi:MAG TPA: AAA family ATPase [Phycisphaerae bacterium]|nr:AAA family ATPase [Phycisphaerae bacterium]